MRSMFASWLMYCLCVMWLEYAGSASFDQSQFGNLNVQMDLKDLHIIALMKGGKEEYVDYDYAYDYNEMTIKPQNGTTPKPSNSTSSANSVDSSEDGSSTSLPATTTTLGALNTTVTATQLEMSTDFMEDSGNKTFSVKPIVTTEPYANVTAIGSGCKKGFAVNEKGDCELKLQNVGTNALLKLVKLSQKLKLRREKRTTTARRISKLT